MTAEGGATADSNYCSAVTKEGGEIYASGHEKGAESYVYVEFVVLVGGTSRRAGL